MAKIKFVKGRQGKVKTVRQSGKNLIKAPKTGRVPRRGLMV